MKFSLLFLLFFVLLCCSKYDDYKYETRKMDLYNADNSGESPVDAGNAVDKKAYGIRLRFGMVLTDNSGDTDNYESSYVNEDQITSFNISSPDTLDSFLPFTTLNSLFNYSSGSSSTGQEITLDKFRYYASGGPPRYDQDFKEDWTTDHYIYLMKPPVENGDYTFIVDFTFSDGRLLSDTIDVTLF